MFIHTSITCSETASKLHGTMAQRDDRCGCVIEQSSRYGYCACSTYSHCRYSEGTQHAQLSTAWRNRTCSCKYALRNLLYLGILSPIGPRHSPQVSRARSLPEDGRSMWNKSSRVGVQSNRPMKDCGRDWSGTQQYRT